MSSKLSIESQSISKMFSSNPKEVLMDLATSGEAINKEVPESTIAESSLTFLLPIEMLLNPKTHQAYKVTG
jgi:hypothetical protein